MFDFVHLHPIFVHFPVALLIAGLVFELAALITKNEFYKKAGLYLFIAGAVTLVAAYFTGDFASEKLGGDEGPFHQIIEVHENAAGWTLWLVIGATVLRFLAMKIKKQEKMLQYAFLAIYLLAVASMVKTGYTGGQLVYKSAIGVQSPAATNK